MSTAAINGEHAPIYNCKSQSDLAKMLGRYFHGRFKGQITQSSIASWGKGERLRTGTPLPPIKEGNRFIGKTYVEWMEAHVLTDPRWRVGAGDSHLMDIYEQADLAKAESSILDKETKRVEFDRVSGRYVMAESAKNTRRGALKIQHSIFRRALEHDDTKTRADWLAAKLSPEDLMKWREFDVKLAQARVDFVEAQYAKAAIAEPEKELARQLAEDSQ